MAEKSDIWMPLYIADYLGDTMHLNTEQHGAYLLIMFAYWRRRGPLPDDDGQLAAAARMPVPAWRRMRGVLAGFFQVKDGLWAHKRVEEELRYSAAMRQQKSRAAHVRWAKHPSASPVADACASPVADATRDAGTMRRRCPSPSPSQGREEEHTHRAGAQGFAEAPSLTEVIAWGREWPGEMASSTPAFDLDWLRDWFDRVDNYQPPIWPRLRDWRTDCVTQWRKVCRASAKKSGGAGPGAKPTAQAMLPAWQRKAELEGRIAQHPANPESGFDGVVTPELEAGLQRLEDELAELEAKKPATA